MSLMGIDLPQPVRVRKTADAPFHLTKPTGIARNFKTHVNSDRVRVLRDGTKQWETWHRDFWELDESGPK